MPTTVYGLVTGKSPGDTLGSAQVNKLGDTAELFYVGMGELLGHAGPFHASDFNGTVVPGELALTISGGLAFVGDPDERKLIRQVGSVTLEAADGIVNAATNWFWLNRDTGLITATQSSTPPAESVLLCTAPFSGGEATSVNNAPTGRTNLLPVPSDGQVLTSAADSVRDYLINQVIGGTGITITEESDGAGGKRLRFVCTVSDTDTKVKASGTDTTADTLTNKISAGANAAKALVNGGSNEHLTLGVLPDDITLDTKTFSVPLNSDLVLEWDFHLKGSFPNGGYEVYLPDPDQLPPNTMFVVDATRTATKFYLTIQNAGDAGAGYYGLNTDLQITPHLRGFGWSAAGGGADVVTTHALDFGSAGGGSNTVPLAGFYGTDVPGSGPSPASSTWLGLGQFQPIHRDCVLTGYAAVGQSSGGYVVLTVSKNGTVIITTAAMDGSIVLSDSSDSLTIPLTAGDSLTAAVEAAGASSGAGVILYGYFL